MIVKFVCRYVLSCAFTLFLATPALSVNYTKLPLGQLTEMARKGDKQAQVELATAFENGEGVSKDVDLAISWYCLAASRGSIDAQRSLGWIYATGKGVAKDDKLASYWLNRAAKSGDAYAGRLLKLIGDNSAKPSRIGCTPVANAGWLNKRCINSSCREIVALIDKLAVEYRLDANLVLAVVAAESAFNPLALSAKNAQGLMQLIPETARRFGVKDAWDSEQNLRGGMAYLCWLLAYFEGNVEYALAAYNAGENRVLEYNGVPPFAETRAYVKRIIRDYGKSFHHFDKSWLQGSRQTGDSVVQNDKAIAANISGG